MTPALWSPPTVESVGCGPDTAPSSRRASSPPCPPRVGALAARAATTDVVDATVVEGALRRHDLVVTSDPDDLKAIGSAVGRRLEVDRP
jgi:hypothetical protein